MRIKKITRIFFCCCQINFCSLKKKSHKKRKQSTSLTIPLKRDEHNNLCTSSHRCRLLYFHQFFQQEKGSSAQERRTVGTSKGRQSRIIVQDAKGITKF